MTNVAPAFVRTIDLTLDHWHSLDVDVTFVDKQRRNLLQAVQFGLRLKATRVKAARIAIQYFDFVETKGYWFDWIPLVEQALKQIDSQLAELKFRLHVCLAQLYRLSRQSDLAIEEGNQAQRLAFRLEEDQLNAEAYSLLSDCYLDTHKYAMATRYAEQALHLFETLDVKAEWLAAVHNTLGQAHRFQGDHESAAKYLKQALAFAESRNLTRYIINIQTNLALNSLAEKNDDQAETYLLSVREHLKRVPSDLDQSHLLINLGIIYFRRDDWEQAELIFREANSAYLQKSSHTHVKARVQNNIGNACSKQGKYNKALNHLSLAIDLWRRVEDELELANSLGSTADIFKAQNKPQEAEPLYIEAIELVKKFSGNAWAQRLLSSFEQGMAEIQNGS